MLPKPSSKIMKSGARVPKDIMPYALSEMSGSGTTDSKPKRSGAGPSPGQNKHPDERSEIEREAYELGFAAGEKAGHVFGIKKLDQTQKLLSDMVEQLDRLQMELVKAAEQDILAIALAVAQRILGEEVSLSRQRIMANIQEAIKKIGQSEKIVVRLAPSDIEMISQGSDELSRFLNQGGRLKFEADDHLLPGECLVDGQERMVDSRIQSQINIFAEAFSQEINET